MRRHYCASFSGIATEVREARRQENFTPKSCVLLVAVAGRHGGELQNYVARVVIMAEQPAGSRPRSGTYFAQQRLPVPENSRGDRNTTGATGSEAKETLNWVLPAGQRREQK
jgi:hypothetical protein